VSLLVILFALMTAVILQSSIPAWGGFAAAKAPLVLGLVIYVALTRSRRVMLLTAFGAGVLQDALSLIPMGFSSVCLVLTGLVVSRFRHEVFEFKGVTHMFFGAVASGAYALGMGLLLRYQGLGYLGLGSLLYRTAAATLAGALVVPLWCRAVEELDRRLGVLEGGLS
jgi:rod shape-determining protein MreD